MSKANKTQKTDASVDDFIDAIEHAQRREDSRRVCALMRDITGDQGAMWGTSIVGFGDWTYQYASGRSNAWFRTGFSPRKQQLVVYIMPGFSQYETLLGKLGKHKTGKSCLYIKKMSDIDEDVLRELIQTSSEAVGT